MSLRHARFARWANPVRLQVVSVVAGALAVGLLAYFTMTAVVDSTGSAARDSAADTHATGVADAAWEIDRLMSSAPVLNLAPRNGVGPPRLTPQLPMSTAVEIATQLDWAVYDAERLHEMVGSELTLQLLGATDDAQKSFEAYVEDPSPEGFEAFTARTNGLRLLVDRLQPILFDGSQANEAQAARVATIARVAVLASVLVSSLLVGATTWLIGRRLRAALEHAGRETQAFAASALSMRRRNEQFEALYQVVSEVTETLSLKYVVQTAVREARKLVRADVVELRLLRGEQLAVAGTDQDAPPAEPGPGPLSLGGGLAGRAAKRGKSVRVDSAAAASMAPEELFDGTESALVVPLIVGARVVGTLSCWSRQAGAFSADDERVVELMASQVATAVAAAGMHEETEREAHHDALTSLPNRRQLSRDVRERFGPRLASELPVVVAMVDVDHFKRFNDDYGHKMGDITLQRVAEVLRSSVSAGDHVYRYGGEEFVIVFDGLDAGRGLQVMERVRAAVQRTPLTGEDLRPVGPVTISAGVVCGPDHGTDFDQLLQLADSALYQAKSLGRNRVEVYDPASSAQAQAAA
jgi:diguanylate cyclase (GGDEF)-like protein